MALTQFDEAFTSKKFSHQFRWIHWFSNANNPNTSHKWKMQWKNHVAIDFVHNQFSGQKHQAFEQSSV